MFRALANLRDANSVVNDPAEVACSVFNPRWALRRLELLVNNDTILKNEPGGITPRADFINPMKPGVVGYGVSLTRSFQSSVAYHEKFAFLWCINTFDTLPNFRIEENSVTDTLTLRQSSRHSQRADNLFVRVRYPKLECPHFLFGRFTFNNHVKRLTSLLEILVSLNLSGILVGRKKKSRTATSAQHGHRQSGYNQQSVHLVFL